MWNKCRTSACFLRSCQSLRVSTATRKCAKLISPARVFQMEHNNASHNYYFPLFSAFSETSAILINIRYIIDSLLIYKTSELILELFIISVSTKITSCQALQGLTSRRKLTSPDVWCRGINTFRPFYRGAWNVNGRISRHLVKGLYWCIVILLLQEIISKTWPLSYCYFFRYLWEINVNHFPQRRIMFLPTSHLVFFSLEIYPITYLGAVKVNSFHFTDLIRKVHRQVKK